MPATSHLRGHQIENNGSEWVYCDTKESTVETHMERGCGYCHKSATPEGHDACLGTLPNVMNACCGHGHVKEAYVQFSSEICVRGENAVEIMEILKGQRM